MFEKCLIIILLYLASNQCLVVVPERANITKQSHEYVEDTHMWVSRLSRKSPYFINVVGTAKQAWYNNVTLNLLFFQHLHNEYRRSFVEMHLNFCDCVNSDPFIGKMLQNYISCPLLPGRYELLNMTVPLQHFNYSVPFRKFKVELSAMDRSTKKVMVEAYVYGEIRNK